MTTRVTAVYQNGVLRPTQPLPLAEGETVEITLERPAPAKPALTDEEFARRIQAAQTLEEVFAIADEGAEEDDGYDILQALDENRRRSGVSRMLCPPELKGVTW